MNSFTDSIITILLIWGIPVFMVVRAFLKMSLAEREEALTDFKSFRLISTIGLMSLGAFLAHVGMVFSLDIVEMAGMVSLVIGCLISAVDLWKSNRGRSALMLVITFVVLAFMVV
jgi:hypothetical protein